MYVHFRFPPSGRRLIVGVLLAVALFFNTVGTLFAGTTGTISGTITDTKSGAPLANVTVTAVSPSARYNSKTDSKGFVSFTGVSPDTYTVSFELSGFQPASITGVNVYADQQATISTTLAKSLVTIGRVTARSVGGAFQPTQPTDTYTVTASQIQTAQGKTFATSETNLLSTLPGVTIDSSGYPVLRGGRENEEGFQFEGIDYTDAFTNQFVNSLALNGQGSLQLTPGAGDASSGNTGTGTINLLLKKGAYPAFGTLDLEAEAAPYRHQLGFEYGFATPNGRLSNFISYTGGRQASQYGEYGSDSTTIDAFYNRSFETSDDFVDNLIYKFGRDNNQSLQFVYQTQTFNFIDNYGGITGLYFKSNDPYFLANVQANLPYLTTSQIQQTIGLFPGQTSPTEPLNQYSHTVQPNQTYKIQYSNNLNASTYLTTKFYQVNAVPVFSLPFDTVGFGGTNEQVIVQGGQRVGIQSDLTKQLNSKNLIGVGGKFEFLHPVNSYSDASLGFLAAAGFSHSLEVLDFLPADNCPTAFAGLCGYLTGKVPAGTRIPAFDQSSPTNRQDFGTYLQDTYSPTDRIKLNAGLRVEGTNYQFPAINSGLYDPTRFVGLTQVPSEYKTPIEVEPKVSISVQLSRNDAVRASFTRSTEFAPVADVNSYVPAGYYSAFAGIASRDPLTGKPAAFCGPSANLTCTNYADQLYWENQTQDGIPIQPAKPETFTNYDFSYSHQFRNNVGVKITPFYRRGYDALALTSAPLMNANGTVRTDNLGNVIFGPTSTTNLGVSKTTGVEFQLTKEAAFGLSGSVNATYINEFSNVPPLSSSEDFFPTIPGASLALGNLYRVGFLTPFQATAAVQYRTHSGLRINPVIQYFRGYPLGAGQYTSAFVNGIPYNVTQTNITSPSGSPGATSYVCPTNPGTVLHPNVCATRGTPEGASAGAFLGNATMNTNLSIEFSPPGSHNTFGVQFLNLFNQLYTGELLSGRYQPATDGIAGPKTGYSNNPIFFPGEGFRQYTPAEFGQAPYINPVNGVPLSVRFYYQLGL